MEACKHGHLDGAMHIPCYECRSEHLQGRVAKLEDALRHILWIKDCGIDSVSEDRESLVNHPDAERDAMYRIAGEALLDSSLPQHSQGKP